MSSASDGLDAVQWCRIDARCCDFEEAWQRGERPPLGDFLGTEPEPVRSVLFRELLLAELAQRRARGERPRQAEYETRWAEFRPLLPGIFAEAGHHPAVQ